MATRTDKRLLHTFEGVLAPALVWVVGPLFFLRLPWVVGNAGLVESIGIVLAAHVVSIATGLSLASVATDRGGTAGGAYALLSRSLGLPVGGTLGVALFLGLALGASVAVLGLSESLLALFALDPRDGNALRLTGTLTLLPLAGLAYVAPSIPTRAAYGIAGVLALALLAVLFGAPEVPAEAAQIGPPHVVDRPTMFDLLAVIFPGIAGFTAGILHAGELVDPKRAIPRGVLAAIGVGLGLHLLLAVVLAIRVPPEALREGPRILEDLAVWGPAVTAGVFCAAIACALAALVASARLLAAMVTDGVGPRWIARAHGTSGEPRLAMLVALGIVEVGVLVGDLNTVAATLTMVLLAAFALLNATCAVERVVSPDFRPELRIPKTVSVVGAVAAILVMIEVSLAGTAAAAALLTALFVYLQRRRLQLDSGDAWEGVWSTLVRAGLHRLARASGASRSWRPNLLMFRPDDGAPREGLRRMAATLIGGSGMLTDVRVGEPGAAPPADTVREAGPVVGVFDHRVETEAPLDTIHDLARLRGFAGVEPNSVLVDWGAYASDRARFAALLERLRALPLEVLAYAEGGKPPAGLPRVDVWWRPESSPALGIALARTVAESPAFGEGAIRFLSVSRDASIVDGLRSSTRRMLEEAHLAADVEVILDTVEPRPLERHVGERSRDAHLAIVELPREALDEPALARLAELAAGVPSVLFAGPSARFRGAGRVLRGTSAERVEERVPLDRDSLPPLVLPGAPALAQHVERFAGRLDDALDRYFDEGLARVGARNAELLDATEALIIEHLAMLREGLDAKTNPVKRRRHTNRVQSAFLLACGKRIEEFVRQDLADQRDIVESRAHALLEDSALVDPDEILVVERDAEEYEAARDDGRELEALKRSRRLAAADGTVKDEIAPAPLARWYVQRELADVTDDITRDYVEECWRLAVALLSVFNASRTTMALLHGESVEGEALDALLDAAQKSAAERIDALRRRHADRLAELRVELAAEGRQLAQRYGDELARIDLPLLLESSRKPPPASRGAGEGLLAAGAVLYEHQKALFERALVGLKVSAFQHRLATIVERTREAVALEIKNGVSASLRAMIDAVRAFLASESQSPLALRLDREAPLDPQALVEAFVRDAQRSADELPETVRTLSDESIQRLADGDPDHVELVDLPLRRIAQFLVDVRLVGPLTEILATVPTLEEKAIGVTEDVARFIGFHQGEVPPEAESFHAHMRPVVERSLARLEAEQAELDALGPRIEALLEARLAEVLRGTDVYELTSSAQALGQQVRRHHGQRAMSGAQSLALDAVARLQQAFVGAVYGRSAGVLLARRLRDAGDGGTLLDRVQALVERHRPDPAVLETVPFYYRQLFLGKNTFNETFWVEREAELAAARRGIAQHERGVRGVLVVTGEPDGGKTALCRRLLSRALAKRPTYWVSPPESCEASVERFAQALGEATGERGSPAQIVAALPDRSVVVIEDLELWWERSGDGLVVVDELLACVQAHGDRVLFVIEIASHPFALIDRLRRLGDRALAVVECGPLPAEALKEIVMLRHGGTGVTFELEGVPESALADWRVARLFSRHFTASRGLVGVALAGWIAHIERATDGAIRVRSPGRRAWDALDALRPEWIAILIQLLLHKRLTRARLARISGLTGPALDDPLDVLLRVGLVHRSRHDVLRLDRFVTHALIDRLRARRVIG